MEYVIGTEPPPARGLSLRKAIARLDIGQSLFSPGTSIKVMRTTVCRVKRAAPGADYTSSVAWHDQLVGAKVWRIT